MLVAPLVNPKAGESVLDLCSAPGGKALHMAMLMGNRGTIIAADLYPHRLKLLRGMVERLGIEIIRTEKLDGREIPSEKHGILTGLLDVLLRWELSGAKGS